MTTYLSDVGLRTPATGNEYCSCNDGEEAVDGTGGVYCNCSDEEGEEKPEHDGDHGAGAVYCDCESDGEEKTEGAGDDDEEYCTCGHEHVGKYGDREEAAVQTLYPPRYAGGTVRKQQLIEDTPAQKLADAVQKTIAVQDQSVRVAELRATVGMPRSEIKRAYITMARRMVQHLKRRSFVSAGPAKLVSGKWWIPFMSVIKMGPIHMQTVTVVIDPDAIDRGEFRVATFWVQNVLRDGTGEGNDRISSTNFRVKLVPERQALRRANKT